MATVESLTKARMLAIEAASVVSGLINGSGHLILSKFDGSEIDAGYMIASVPDASTTVKGIVELATAAEALTGTDTTRAVTPASMVGSISTDKLVDSAVATAKIADSAVTSAKIANGTIATGDLADSAVTSAKIADATIATGDLADGAVTSAKIADATIVTGDLAAATLASSSIGIPGEIRMWSGSTVPTGWLLCDGSAVNRTTYAALYAITNTTYGAGNGTSTFNLPNFKGRVPVGYDSSQTEFDALGETGGAKTHTLTEAQIPSHSHPLTFVNTTGVNGYIPLGSSGTSYGGNTGNTGGGQAHNNLQPYLTVQYIIKY